MDLSKVGLLVHTQVSITLSRGEIFENVGFSFTCGRTKTVSNSEYEEGHTSYTSSITHAQ